jgi:hypothetical protein
MKTDPIHRVGGSKSFGNIINLNGCHAALRQEGSVLR